MIITPESVNSWSLTAEVNAAWEEQFSLLSRLHIPFATPTRSFVLIGDVDNTIGAYTPAFRLVVADHFGVTPESLGDPVDYLFTGWGLGGSPAGRALFNELHNKAVVEYELFKTMPVITGAREALHRLSDDQVCIRIATFRLFNAYQHDPVIPQTAAWFELNQIPFSDLAFFAKKSDIDGDILIDDNPSHVADHLACGKNAVLFDQPYNRGLDLPRVHGWDHAYTFIAALKQIHDIKLERYSTWKAARPTAA